MREAVSNPAREHDLPEYVSKEKLDSEHALSSELISAGSQQLQRKLGGKEIQLFAVGGAIGTCMDLILQCLP